MSLIQSALIQTPWFIGQKARNVLIMKYVLKHHDDLTSAELVGLHFSQHKNKASDPDVPKHKWTREKVCEILGLSLTEVEIASKPILDKIDVEHAQSQKAEQGRFLSLNPFYVVAGFSGDGVSSLEKPFLAFDRENRPYVRLMPTIGWFAETYARDFVFAMGVYFRLPVKKPTPRQGSVELQVRAQASIDRVLFRLADADHAEAHVHKVKVAQLNLLAQACALRRETGGYVQDYAALEALMAESFRVAFLSSHYKTRTYTYDTITVAMAKHLGLSTDVCKPYGFYVSEAPPADYLDRSGVSDPIVLPKPKPKRKKPQDPRSKAIVAYGYKFPSLAESARGLKPIRADLELKLGRKIRIDRKGLGQKLKDPQDFDVVWA